MAFSWCFLRYRPLRFQSKKSRPLRYLGDYHSSTSGVRSQLGRAGQPFAIGKRAYIPRLHSEASVLCEKRAQQPG